MIVLYQLMSSCWEKIPNNRPSFEQLYNRIHQLWTEERKNTGTDSSDSSDDDIAKTTDHYNEDIPVSYYTNDQMYVNSVL